MSGTRPMNQLLNCLVTIVLQLSFVPPVIQRYEHITVQEMDL